MIVSKQPPPGNSLGIFIIITHFGIVDLPLNDIYQGILEVNGDD